MEIFDFAVGYLMMSHIGFGTVQQPLELQSICISIRYHISNLADNRCEYEYTDQIADYGENVSVSMERRFIHQVFLDNKSVRIWNLIEKLVQKVKAFEICENPHGFRQQNMENISCDHLHFDSFLNSSKRAIRKTFYKTVGIFELIRNGK